MRSLVWVIKIFIFPYNEIYLGSPYNQKVQVFIILKQWNLENLRKLKLSLENLKNLENSANSEKFVKIYPKEAGKFSKFCWNQFWETQRILYLKNSEKFVEICLGNLKNSEHFVEIKPENPGKLRSFRWNLACRSRKTYKLNGYPNFFEFVLVRALIFLTTFISSFFILGFSYWLWCKVKKMVKRRISWTWWFCRHGDRFDNFTCVTSRKVRHKSTRCMRLYILSLLV